jgi:2'-5' RNA ligase
MEQVRTFVAIELSDLIREQLSKAQTLLKRKGIADQLRWVQPQSIHLTLKFLGNVPVSRLKEIVIAIEQASDGMGPFSLSLGSLGCFPSGSRPNVIWIGLGGDTRDLARLHTKMDDRLSVLGYPTEKRKFTPHLTLARVDKRVKTTDRRRLGGLIERLDVDLVGEMEVREITLMKSDLTPTGAKYTRLAVIELER